MKDRGMCPHCEKEFEVTEYGYRLNCPNCQKKIDIFPEPVYIETKWGTFGLPKNILSFLPMLKFLIKGTK